MKPCRPLRFFRLLEWLDGSPLIDNIEEYRQTIFSEALHTFNEDGRPKYNFVLCGRGKKNWKSVDLILAALYKLLAVESALGNQVYILANDQAQANDDLIIAKKIIDANPILQREVVIQKNIILRKDDKGFLEILPALNAIGQHGKTFLFCGYDEAHGYRDWSLMEALQLDPHRLDSLIWVSSYASLYSYRGAPLFDLCEIGKSGDDPRMFFSWYSGDYCTDPDFASLPEPEQRANPTALPDGYLQQQKRRLPSHKYRRLHLNIGGQIDGAYFSAELVENAIVKGRVNLPPERGRYFYRAFIDMSGGSHDDAVLVIGHADEDSGRTIIDYIGNQGRKPPFDPRQAVDLFAGILKSYAIASVTGDAFAGRTFVEDFQRHDIAYNASALPKSALYERLEIELNSGRVAMPDHEITIQQLLGLVMRGSKIDHIANEKDDFANGLAGCVFLCRGGAMVACDFEEDSFFVGREDSMQTWSDKMGAPDSLAGSMDDHLGDSLIGSPWDF